MADFHNQCTIFCMNPETPTLTPQEIEEKLSVPEVKPKDPHWIAVLSMAVFILLSLSAVAFLYYQNQQLKSIVSSYQTQPTSTPLYIYVTPTPVATESASPKGSPTPSVKACTQEAKLCPDGSYVGRTGPNCEFAPCPTP
jgi:hypothetical protein